jgi:hypothetical protein
VLGAICLGALALAASGCGAERAAEAAPRAAACPKAWHAGWQALANRIHADVYCPTWMPNPIDAHIGGSWNNIDSVSADRSYLIGFVWQETGNGSGEVHVNFRGYPGRTAIPRCQDSDTGVVRMTPCFADAHGHKRAPGINAVMYTVNQGADTWHVLYAWRHRGALYAISEHVAPPFSYARVVENLDRMLRGLVVVHPHA